MSVSRETGRGARERIARRDSRQSRERTGSLAPYVVHVYEVRPLRRIVEHRVILLDEALADRLVRHVQRHGGGPTSCDQRRCDESQARRLMRFLSLSLDTLRTFRFDFGSYDSYEREAAPCNIPRVVRTVRAGNERSRESSRDTSKTARTSRTFSLHSPALSRSLRGN